MSLKKSFLNFINPEPFVDQILIGLGIIKFAFILFFPWGKADRMKRYYAKLLAFLIEDVAVKLKKPFKIFQFIEDDYFIRLRGKFNPGKQMSDEEFKSFILKDMTRLKDSDVYVRSTKTKNVKDILLAKEFVEKGASEMGKLN